MLQQSFPTFLVIDILNIETSHTDIFLGNGNILSSLYRLPYSPCQFNDVIELGDGDDGKEKRRDE